jgi:uncharacterized protein
MFDAALTTLMSPPILFFLLGVLAAFARSDLTIPEPIAKGMAIYLMVAIGFKGGKEVALAGLSDELIIASLLGIALSFTIPLVAYALLRRLARLDGINAAAIAAHYGSISIVTFITAQEIFASLGLRIEGYMVAVMALMETPAILTGLLLAGRHITRKPDAAHDRGEVLREVLLNGSVVLLMGAFVIGIITGPKGFDVMAPLIDTPFRAVLCFFLLDMGLVAARRLADANVLNLRLVAFGLAMPVIGAVFGVAAGIAGGLPESSVAALAVLCASASYIAVPAAIRMTLPQANPGLYLTLSLAVTFPFNITIGVPLYVALTRWWMGG